jgi:DNA helicase-2/ATP-dependent DNA helicase PcrA
MFRMNSQSRKLEEVFIRRKVPHRVIGVRFYQRREIKDLLAYLHLLLNPDNSVNLLRVVNVPARGIGAKTIAELQRLAVERGMSLFRAIRVVAGLDGQGDVHDAAAAFVARTLRQLTAFAVLVDELRQARQSLGLVDLLSTLVSRISYAEYLRDGSEEGEERWDNVKELLTVAAEYAGLAPEAALEEFLAEAALVSDADEVDERADAVSLITLHAAKGLEFPVVFIVGMEDGVMPHSRSFDDPERMEEERRLCYVGITRAKQLLHFSYAARRNVFGGVTANAPSRFLADVPDDLRNVQSAVRRAQPAARPSPLSPRPKLPPEVVLTGPPPRSEPPRQRFRPGDKVRHVVFGEGIVTRSVLTPTDEELEVAFPDRGLKKLSVAYARLDHVR